MGAEPTITKISPAFEDERGVITNILTRPELKPGIAHVAIITSKRESVRGNHWHPEDWQIIYVIEGGFVARYQQLELMGGRGVTPFRTTQVGEMIVKNVNAGDLEFIPPGWAHAYRYTEDTVFLNITPGDRDVEGYGTRHTIPYTLIQPPPEL